MSHTNLYFALCSSLLMAALLAVVLSYYLRARRRSQTDWQTLFDQLVWIDRDGVALVARDGLAEQGDAADGNSANGLDPQSIWDLIGGLDGLELLERNCRVLVELAAYVQQWYPEALVVAEQLRLNAREIEWHVGRLKGAAKTGNLQRAFADYAQRAVVIYYLMTQNLLCLYQQASVPGLEDLQKAL